MSERPWGTAVERVRRCATHKGRRQQGLYVIEGERLIRRALKARARIEEILVAERCLNDREHAALRDLAANSGVVLQGLPEAVLLDLAEGRNSGACVALARLPVSPSLETWWSSRPQPGARELLLIVVNVREPGNVGALVRTALASGVTGLIALGETDPFHPKAVRSSMGSVFKLALCTVSSTEFIAPFLRKHGVQQVAAVAAGGAPLPGASFGERPLALYVGNEAQGLPDDLLDRMDLKVTIAMPSGVDSFSVNAATAIALYEARRQSYEKNP